MEEPGKTTSVRLVKVGPNSQALSLVRSRPLSSTFGDSCALLATLKHSQRLIVRSRRLSCALKEFELSSTIALGFYASKRIDAPKPNVRLDTKLEELTPKFWSTILKRKGPGAEVGTQHDPKSHSGTVVLCYSVLLLRYSVLLCVTTVLLCVSLCYYCVTTVLLCVTTVLLLCYYCVTTVLLCVTPCYSVLLCVTTVLLCYSVLLCVTLCFSVLPECPVTHAAQLVS